MVGSLAQSRVHDRRGYRGEDVAQEMQQVERRRRYGHIVANARSSGVVHEHRHDYFSIGDYDVPFYHNNEMGGYYCDVSFNFYYLF